MVQQHNIQLLEEQIKINNLQITLNRQQQHSTPPLQHHNDNRETQRLLAVNSALSLFLSLLRSQA